MGASDGEDTRGAAPTQSTVVDAWHGQANTKTSEPLAPGAALGRYVILDVLGKGGMGLVYKAYDPELDRQIAVKLVRVRGVRKRRAQQRLLREAQALAQLSHPNVIAVYDVGTIGDDVFISMELVDGSDGKKWLDASTRSRAEILSLFIAAGRGLDAAHKAGMVHRDFKPENVVVGSDGRPRVIDFGLARGTETADDDEDDSDSDFESGDSHAISGSSKNRLNTPLTQVGLVMGTPAYMAPEHHEGKEVDARSDQFSFCVSLYLALYGTRPFSGADPKELKDNIIQGTMSSPPASSNVPRWIRSIVLRGLATKPQDRYPSMRALLEALERDPAIRRNRVLRTMGFAGVVAGAALWATSGTKAEAKCQDGQHALEGIWDTDTRQATKQAFLSTGRGHAASTFGLLDQRLSAYGDDWVGMYKESCEATNVRGDQSEQLLDLRTQCLHRRLDKMAAFTALLTKANSSSLVDRSVSEAASLQSLDACADTQRLTSAIPLPEDPQTQAAVAAARQGIDRSEALSKAGDFQGALELSESIAASVASLDYAPVKAEALYLLGGNQRRRRMAAEAEETLYAAARMAAEARDDDIAALTWLELLWVVGYAKAKPDEALNIRHLVEPVVIRSGSQPRRADLLNNLGAILRRKGKYSEAKEILEEAIEIWDVAYGKDSLQVAKAHNNLGNVLNDMGDFKEARRHHEQVLKIRRDALGENHPFVATVLNNLGNSYMEESEYAQARDYYQRSLTIAESLDPTGDDVVNALNNLGNSNAELGDYVLSRQLQERALKIQQDHSEPDNAAIGITINNLGDLFLKQKEFALAMKHYEQSRDLWTKSLGPEHVYIAHASYGIGISLIGLERFVEAASVLERAKAIWSAVHGESHATVAMTLEGLGDCSVGLGQGTQAVEHLARAMTIREADEAPLQLEVTRFGLARAYWAAGQHARALELAVQAESVLKDAPAEAGAELTQIRSWVAKHPAP